MFDKEVEIMTDVIIQLNKQGIYVGYIYDALFCHPMHAEHVKNLMDETILNHGVKTTAKIPTKFVDILKSIKNIPFMNRYTMPKSQQYKTA
jgi:hypothetical protein